VVPGCLTGLTAPAKPRGGDPRCGGPRNLSPQCVPGLPSSELFRRDGSRGGGRSPIQSQKVFWQGCRDNVSAHSDKTGGAEAEQVLARPAPAAPATASITEALSGPEAAAPQCILFFFII
jgi:hypothetical protein